MYEEGPGGLVQIHDFNPGIADNGLFWAACIDEQNVSADPGNGRASLRGENLGLRDYSALVNALLEGPSVPAVASFEIQWSSSCDKHHFHYAPATFDAAVVFNSARVWWQAETESVKFVSDAAATSFSRFAEVGHERNGVFFPGS